MTMTQLSMLWISLGWRWECLWWTWACGCDNKY